MIKELVKRVMTLVNNETDTEREARMHGAFDHEEEESSFDECCGPTTWDESDEEAIIE